MCVSVCVGVWVYVFDATWSCPADNGPRNGMQIKMCHELGTECGRLQVPRPVGECDLNRPSWHSNRRRRETISSRRKESGSGRGWRTVVKPKFNHNWKLLMNHKSVKSYVILTTTNTTSLDRRLGKQCLDRTNPRLVQWGGLLRGQGNSFNCKQEISLLCKLNLT